MHYFVSDSQKDLSPAQRKLIGDYFNRTYSGPFKLNGSKIRTARTLEEKGYCRVFSSQETGGYIMRPNFTHEIVCQYGFGAEILAVKNS